METRGPIFVPGRDYWGAYAGWRARVVLNERDHGHTPRPPHDVRQRRRARAYRRAHLRDMRLHGRCPDCFQAVNRHPGGVCDGIPF